MAFLSEAEVEQALLAQLRGLGYQVTSDEEVGPDGQQPERKSYSDVVLKKRFAAAVARGGQNKRRPDVVVFVNGLPLGVIELKAPGSAGAHLLGAFSQLQPERPHQGAEGWLIAPHQASAPSV